MSYLSDGGVYTLTDEGADRLIELEESKEKFPLPAGFRSHLVTTSDEVVKEFKKMGFHLPSKEN